MRRERRTFGATASVAIIWMVSAAACDGRASHGAFSGVPPVERTGGIIPTDAGVDALDTAAPIDAPFDMRAPPAPDAGAPVSRASARDAGTSPPVATPSPHDAAVSPPATVRDATAVDAPDPSGAKVDAATDASPIDAAAPDAHDGASPMVAPAHVFVIAMENESAADIYGSINAPYISATLLPAAASASAFVDELPALPSEPHYIWMEAGTNAFSDHTFTTDDSPSAANSTASTQHLVTQIREAGRGLDWMSYQEGIDAGECPVTGAGVYVPRHDPTLFFRDIAGDPPSAGNAYCSSHHRPLSALAGDVASGAVASYVFITPNLCHDMHGSPLCPTANDIRAGDDWLASALPPLVAYVEAHGGVVFVTWDEGSPLPFIAVGPQIKAGYRSTVQLHHGSMLKTIEEMLRLPILPTVQSDSDLSDLFVGGAIP